MDLKVSDVQKLTAFHNRCVRKILGVSTYVAFSILPLDSYPQNLACVGQLLILFWTDGCNGLVIWVACLMIDCLSSYYLGNC